MRVDKRIVPGMLAVLALPLLATAAGGQDPDSRWRRRNDRGNRYEGRVEIPVGRPQLDVLSLLGHREPYSGSADLKVRFFQPAEGEVSIVARELRERVKYWMEAKPQQDWLAGRWNEFGPWQTKVVLSREQVPASNLAVLARLESGDETLLLPAFVYHTERPAAVDGYTLYLRPDSDLRELSWALKRGDETLRQGKLVKTLYAGEAFSIKMEAKDLPAGRMRLEVAGKFKGVPGGPSKTYHLHHQPL